MPTLEQARRALANVEAKGDFETANLIREAIQQAESPAPVGPSFTERMAVKRAESDARLAELRSRRAPEETGIFEDFTTGFGRGFVGVGESAALGLAALAEEETETQLRDRIKSVADSFAPEGGDPESFTSGLGSAFGSIAGIALPAAGIAVGAAPLGASAALASGLATGTAGILGVSAAAGEASERAREAGVSEEVRSAAALRGAPIGFLDVLPMARFVKSIDVPILSKLVDKLGPEQVNTIGEKVRSAVLTGGYEAGQEVASEALQNLNERQYNETVEIFAGAGEAATFGGIAGGVLDLFLGRRARDIKPKDPETIGELDTEAEEAAQVGARERASAALPEGEVDTEDMFALEKEQAERRLGTPEPQEVAVEEADAEAIKARLFEGLDTDSFDGVATLPEEQQLQFAFRRQDLTRAEKKVLVDAARGVTPATEVSPDQTVMLDETAEIEALVEADEAARLDRQIAAEDAVTEATEAEQASIISASERETATGQQVGEELSIAETRRRTILADVVEQQPTRQENTLTQRFSRALEAEGFTDTQPNEAETAAIARVIDITRAKPIQEEMLPSDSDVTAMEAVVPERQEAAVEPAQESFPGLGRKSRAGLPDLETTPEPTPEPRPVTEEDLTIAGFLPKAAIRKRVIGKELTDPEVKAALVKAGRASKRQEIKAGVDRLLQGVPSEQGDLFTATQRKPDAARDRASDADNIQGVGDGAVSQDPVATGASDTGTMGGVGRGTGGVDVRARTESAPLANTEAQIEGEIITARAALNERIGIIKEHVKLNKDFKANKITKEKATKRSEELITRVAELDAMTVARRAAKKQPATKSQEESAPPTEETITEAETDEFIALAANFERTPDEQGRFEVLRPKALAASETPKAKPTVEKRKRTAKEVRETPTDTKPVESESEIDEGVAKLMGRIEESRFAAAVATTRPDKDVSATRKKGIRTKEDPDKADEVAKIREATGASLTEANRIYETEQRGASRGRVTEGTYGTSFYPTFGMFGTSGKPQKIDTPLEASVVKALYKGDVKGALEALSKTTPDRRARRIAKKLMEYAGTTKLFLVDPSNDNPANMTVGEVANLSTLFAKEKNGELPAGLYVGADNVILLNQRTGINAYTFLHEMTHAATLLEIETNPQSATVKRLKKLYEDVKATYGDNKPYGVTDLNEFVAEAFSNPEFQRELARINPKGGELSSWQRFKEIIARFFGKDTYGESAQSEANLLIEAILAPGVAMRGLPNVPAYSTADGVKEVNKRLAEGSKSNLTEKQSRTSIIRDFMDVFTPDQNPYLKGVMRKTLGILPNQPVFDDIAGKLNIEGANQLGNAIKEQRDLLTKSEDMVKKALDPIVRWSTTASENTMKAFNNLVYSSTIDEVDPELTLDEATKKYGNQKVDTVDGTDQLKIDRYKELRKEYNSGTLGSDGRQAYKNLRKIYADISKDMVASLEGRIDGLNVDEGVKTSLKNQMLARMLAASNVEPYFPLTRNGKYWLAVRNPKDVENPAYITYESLKERGLAKKEFEGMGYKTETYDPATLRNSMQKDAPSSAFMGQILSILKDKNIPAATQEQIAQLYIEAMPETAFSKSLIRRKKSLGYDTDAIEAARSKAYDMARQAARLRGSNKIDALAKAVEESFYAKEKIVTVEKDKKGDEKEVVKDGEFLRSDLQNDRARAVLEEMIDRAQFAVSPPADGIAQFANRNAFIWTIGFNASSALVNLSQIPLFAYPMLSGEYGYKETFDAISTSTKLFTGSNVRHAKSDLYGKDVHSEKLTDKYTIPSLDNYFTYKKVEGKGGEDVYQYSIRTDLNLDDAKAKELKLILPMIQLAAKRGELNTSFLAETLSVDNSGRALTKFDKFTNLSALMFHSAEVMNRQVTMIAAYKLELDKLAGKNKPTALQQQQAAETALHRTQQINGGATLETGPRYAREGLGRVALMYKGYGIQMYYTMLKTGKQAVNNMFPGDNAESRELRNQAFKQLAGIHLSAVFFAGIQGVPLYGAVSLLYDMFQEEYEEDADEALRSYLDNDALFKGVLSEATGLDVSQRVKLTDLLVEADKFNSDPSPEETIGHYFGGPAWSVTSRAIEGFNEIMDGEIERGMESMMPGAIRNGYKALIRYPRDEGILTRRGDVIYDDLTNGDIITQLLGFPPTAYTRAIGETSAAKGMEDAARSKRSKLLKRYYIAMRFGDFDEADLVRDQMDEFNEEEITYIDPKLVITPDTIERSMRRHLTTETKMHNGVLLSPYMKAAVDDVGFL